MQPVKSMMGLYWQVITDVLREIRGNKDRKQKGSKSCPLTVTITYLD